MKKTIEATIFVDKIGESKDYINIPICKDDKAIGVITGSVELPNSYMLKVALWQDVNLELMNNKVSAIYIK